MLIRLLKLFRFLKLGRLIGDALATSRRENDFIYFQRVPAEEPRLELRASHGLAEPLAWQPPAPSPLCSAQAYHAFDLSKRTSGADKGGRKAAPGQKEEEEEKVKPVKEPDLKPQKDTGCVLS